MLCFVGLFRCLLGLVWHGLVWIGWVASVEVCTATVRLGWMGLDLEVGVGLLDTFGCIFLLI